MLVRIPLYLSRQAPCCNCAVIHREFHMSSHLEGKNVRSGVPKTTNNRSKPLTYEQAQKPNHIGVTKAWNSWNTSALYMECKELAKWLPRASETATEDVYIRKFITGTWQNLLLSEPVIKRRANTISIAFLVRRSSQPRIYYFLKGLCEELLPKVLKCIVKIEIQTVDDARDLIFKQI